MKHLIRFCWSTQPLDEIDTAATGAAHSIGVTLLSVEAQGTDVAILAAAGQRFTLRLTPGARGAELVLETRGLESAVGHEAVDFMLALADELGGIRHDVADAHWDRVAS